jgi:hypothetical protein
MLQGGLTQPLFFAIFTTPIMKINQKGDVYNE